MPLVRINIIKGKSKEFKKTLLNSVHEGLIEAFGIADWDRFQRIAEIDKDDFELPEGKTENFMIIELTVFPGRTSEHADNASPYASTTSYFVINKDGRLIGATSLRHYLTVEGFNSWGHIGYGIRPSERRKGYAVQSLKLMLEQAKAKHICKVLIGVHEGNIGSRKTVEKCGGIFENTVFVEGDKEPIRRYWIKVQ